MATKKTVKKPSLKQQVKAAFKTVAQLDKEIAKAQKLLVKLGDKRAKALAKHEKLNAKLGPAIAQAA